MECRRSIHNDRRGIPGWIPPPAKTRPPSPTDTGNEYPTAISIGCPSPRRVRDPDRTRVRIGDPRAVLKRIPVISHAVRTPDVPVSIDGLKCAIGSQVCVRAVLRQLQTLIQGLELLFAL